MANTQSKEVNLTKRVQTGKGLRYCAVVLSPNGRVKPDLVIVNGRPERHSEGAYYLEWREKGRRIRLSVGKDPQDAAARRQRKEAELNALNNGVSVLPESGDGHPSVATAVARFLEETELTKKPKTLSAYTTALNYFTESCPKLYLQDIERADLLKFCAFLRDKKKQAPRSVYNKFENVMTFLKANGIRGLVGKNDWPRYTEEEPEMYEKEDLDKLFTACDAEERLWYEFFLMTGMREQEVMYTYWSDSGHGRSFHGAIYGVGIAGVSAILTAARPDLYAVIDVFALIAIDHYYTFPWIDRVPRDKDGKLQADENSYAPYINFCSLRAGELSKVDQKPWRPRDIDMALWAIGKHLADRHSSSCS